MYHPSIHLGHSQPGHPSVGAMSTHDGFSTAVEKGMFCVAVSSSSLSSAFAVRLLNAEHRCIPRVTQPTKNTNVYEH